ncbi:signal peptidase I [Candidatus Nomurabacteria bacterium RIFCSPHIGHO2_02_FULL_33_12]|uniref:Signal peptidase I n=1 Tax=Candidatus Nomurabacteria bacterium RIFCSPLOWO2_01_FULL_33_17 TaxID=1801764 RepID=A0A1F6WP77_9BACT|nr:MAG: signal peptidase I [Candidatus Nomurabacteria bacterium RIFCSPHIGHO2_02_FULL_33_12]OGI83701.1 MAG: signal peptidase I [Candidatus Nomurabacteria bacterium RIFCSPLOWO2_01_FULL_33_17]
MSDIKIKKKDSIWDIIKFMLLAFIIVIPIRMFIAQPFLVNGRSMDPTLKNHDYLIVDELSYHIREPKRGEVIIFRFPGNTKEHFVKRLIGIPGDTIRIIDGTVTVITKDGKRVLLEEPYVKNHSYESLVDIVVPDGQLFVMGDNRSESYDSRMWRFLPRDLATGRALVRLYPFNNIDYLPGQHIYAEINNTNINNN